MINSILDSKERMKTLLIYILVILISMIFLKHFWNTALVPHITILRPVKTIQDALALSIGLLIVRGC
jgi:hypothetical protein